MTFLIETERLVLTLLREGDEERLFGWAGDPVATRFMGWKRHASLDDSRGFVRRASRPVDDGKRIDFAIAVRRKSDGLLLGTSGVHQRSPRLVETGYILHPDSWRQGYGTEAVRAVIAWIFANMPSIDEVIAPILADNVVSQALARKVGMAFATEELHDLPRGDANVRVFIFSIRRA